MPRVFQEFLDGDNIYACQKCNTHLSTLSDLISQAFRGQTGTAYLFNNVINVRFDAVEEKKLSTGVHDVCDMYCAVCANEYQPKKAIGWKYIRAYNEDQKYKEGKFILEEQLIKKTNWNDQ